jgi:hypothetical protein
LIDLPSLFIKGFRLQLFAFCHSLAPQLVGWVEPSETHRGFEKDDGFRYALPILRALALY